MLSFREGLGGAGRCCVLCSRLVQQSVEVQQVANNLACGGDLVHGIGSIWPS
jgi:hypothetical protein